MNPNEQKEAGRVKSKVFRDGAISPVFISDSIAKHQSKTDIGAHNIFLGQVRKDEINGKLVKAIEYSAYEEMAETQLHHIRESAFSQFDLSCMHIYHSLGPVLVGEICLFIFVSSRHRDEAYRASRYILEAIKKDVPIFGKEIMADESYTWKVNN